MTGTLPLEVQQVFERFVTTELTTIGARGQPITWPVTPFYRPGDPCIDVTTGLGYPRKAADARRNPKVSLLFSDPTGCGMHRPPMVLVQGTAEVDDRDLAANRDRYARDHAEKLGGGAGGGADGPPAVSRQRLFQWYFMRIYLHVRPERVYVWPGGNVEAEPHLLDSHMEEVRSGQDEEPDAPHAPPDGGRPSWSPRFEELGKRHSTAVVSFVAPDGFPFSVRVPVSAQRRARLIHLDADPVGAPLAPGLACLTAHDHDPALRWQRNFQARGDLVRTDGGWAVAPHRLVAGFELPPGGALQRMGSNFRRIRRYRRTARREMKKRGER